MALAKYGEAVILAGPLDQLVGNSRIRSVGAVNTTDSMSKKGLHGKRCSRCQQLVGMVFGLADAPICETCDAHLAAERRAKAAQSVERGHEV